jgi:diguanylate cyclase (GGDEF)-like protein
MTEPFDTRRASGPLVWASAHKDACLVHIYPAGPSLGARYVLRPTAFLIGRSPECDVVINDQSVSRVHARLERRADGHYAIDLNSTNGTCINDEPVQCRRLCDGDYLRIGNCIYRFLAGGNLEAEYHEEIYRLTVIDALTNIRNRRYLVEFLEHELARAVRHGRPLALLLFDIDHFKAVNDELGHLGGDSTLRELARRVKEHVRRDELFARYGGEEFAVVLAESDQAEAVRAAERIRALVEERPFLFDGAHYPVTISVGVAVWTSADPAEIDDLLRRADEKLYAAKAAGRNCVRG